MAVVPNTTHAARGQRLHNTVTCQSGAPTGACDDACFKQLCWPLAIPVIAGDEQRVQRATHGHRCNRQLTGDRQHLYPPAPRSRSTSTSSNHSGSAAATDTRSTRITGSSGSTGSSDARAAQAQAVQAQGQEQPTQAVPPGPSEQHQQQQQQRAQPTPQQQTSNRRGRFDNRSCARCVTALGRP